jgi:hypothetical protein
MERKYLAPILTLAGINALTFAVVGFFTHYITRSAFAAFTLIGCLIFFAGLTMLRDQLTHK